jgi:hypothetical protein
MKKKENEKAGKEKSGTGGHTKYAAPSKTHVPHRVGKKKEK